LRKRHRLLPDSSPGGEGDLFSHPSPQGPHLTSYVPLHPDLGYANAC